MNNASDDTIGFGQLVAVLRCASPTDDSVANFLEIICKIKCTIHLEKKKGNKKRKAKEKSGCGTLQEHMYFSKKRIDIFLLVQTLLAIPCFPSSYEMRNSLDSDGVGMRRNLECVGVHKRQVAQSWRREGRSGN